MSRYFVEVEMIRTISAYLLRPVSLRQILPAYCCSWHTTHGKPRSRLLPDERFSATCLSKRYAGHSEWKNRAQIKGKRDVAKSKIINALMLKIQVAIRLGNGQLDPKSNVHLHRMLELCKLKEVPKDTVTRALERAKVKHLLELFGNFTCHVRGMFHFIITLLDCENKPMVNHTYDIKGPSGSLFIVEVLTDNVNFSRGQLQRMFSKIGGFLFADPNMRYNFDEKSVVTVKADSTPSEEDDALQQEAEDASSSEPSSLAAVSVPGPLTLEDAETLAIDVGAENVEQANEDGVGVIRFVCAPMDANRISRLLKEKRYIVRSVATEFYPKMRVALSPTQQQLVQQFYQKLDEDENVTNVFDNIAAESS